MKKFRFFSVAFAASVLMLGAVSCGDDGPNNNNNNNGFDNEGVKPEDKQYTSEESKEYLESVAKEFLENFKADDQREAIELANHFIDKYGELEMPEEWYDDEDEDDSPYYSPRRVMENLKKGLRNPASLTRVVANVYDFARFAGIYEPDMGNGVWKKTGESKDIIFKFRDSKAQNCEVKAVSNGNSVWTEEVDNETSIKFPGNVTVTVTAGGKNLAKGTVNANPDRKGHTFTANFDVTAANIHTVGSASGNDTKVTQETTVSINGKQLAKATASVNGRYLCDEYTWRDEDIDIEQLANNGHAEVNVLGKLQVKGDISNFRGLGDALDSYYDSYEAEYGDDYSSKSEAKNLCRKDCELLNERIKVNLYYNTDRDQASLIFRPYVYEDDYGYSDYWEIYPESMLLFQDGTTYSFDDYFGNGRFLSVENLWDSLFDSYDAIWK